MLQFSKLVAKNERVPARCRQGYQLVAHPQTAVDQITSDEVRRIFLGETDRYADGTPARAVDQAPDAESRELFTRCVMKQTVGEVRAFWQRSPDATNAPPILDGDAAVLRYVERTPGALGYVSFDANAGGAKVLTVVQPGD